LSTATVTASNSITNFDAVGKQNWPWHFSLLAFFYLPKKTISILCKSEKNNRFANCCWIFQRFLIFNEPFSVDFHPEDLKRLKTDGDRWLEQFLEFNYFNVENALKQFWSALEWRKKTEIHGNEIG
jgi:hypothetical protein